MEKLKARGLEFALREISFLRPLQRISEQDFPRVGNLACARTFNRTGFLFCKKYA